MHLPPKVELNLAVAEFAVLPHPASQPPSGPFLAAFSCSGATRLLQNLRDFAWHPEQWVEKKIQIH